MSAVDRDLETKKLICELCRQFFEQGWVTGTGGSISIRQGEKIFMTPSGVQKERIQPDEIFTVDIDGKITDTPIQKAGCREPKLSDCAPLFLHAYQQRNAGTHARILFSDMLVPQV
jgi:methylthioribulose 1-phosphate dehydratase/enolase-phosphatase E1